MFFVKRLKELVAENGLSYNALAKSTGIPVTTLSNYINRGSLPTAPALCTLAEYFGCSVDYLLGLEDDFGVKQHKDVIKRPAYDITDQKLVDFMKLYEVMTEIQKAQVLGYVIGLLENAGVNVKTVLGY